ncbi:MAG: hypothetical protein ACK4FN_00265 [Acinetobacter johnsonii]
MNLTIEQMRKIVERHRKLGTHFTKFKYYSAEKDDFFLSQLSTDFICVDDLRKAIADHERTDHVTDIRNHISPNTRVSEAHVNEAFKLNRLG